MNNNFYIYAHIRKDNDDVFYIGKGRGRRANTKTRNSHHDAIASKYGMYVKILKDGLSEEDSFVFEKETIEHYVFDLGYGIDIPGYRKKGEHQLSNQTFGGEGPSGLFHSEEWRKKHSEDMTGKNNPMYGINVWDSYSEEKKEYMRKKYSEKSIGKNNPMYGISPEERMSPDVYKEWHKKVSERGKTLVGEKNPNFGNKTLHNKIKDNPELRKQYYSRKGSVNGRSKEINLLDLDGNFVKHFSYIGECAEYVKEQRQAKGSINSIRANINLYTKKGKPFLGFRYEFL